MYARETGVCSDYKDLKTLNLRSRVAKSIPVNWVSLIDLLDLDI